MPEDFPFLTSDDVRELLGWQRRETVYEARQAGRLPTPIQVGRRLLWPRDEFLAWMYSQRAESMS